MQTFKKILIGLGGLVLLVAIVGFCLPAKQEVRRSKTIAAPAGVIYDLVDHYPSWFKWSAWHELDPNMQVTYGGPERGVGSWYTWTGDKEKVGHGKMTTLEAVPNQFLKQELIYEDTDPTPIEMHFTPEGGATKIDWVMPMDCGMNPFARIICSMGIPEKFVGADFERGLHKLDSVARIEAVKPVAPITPAADVVTGAAPVDSAARPGEDRE